MTYLFFRKLASVLLPLSIVAPFFTGLDIKATAYGVCGVKRDVASFKTKSYLLTICPGEASLQLIFTYHDGTGYKRIPVQKEGNKFRGSDGNRNYIVDKNHFLIGTDGEKPVKEVVIEFKN